MDARYGLVLAFDSDDPAFVRGVEIGRLWEMLKPEDGVIEGEIVHTSNAEMVLRMAEATDRPVRSTELGDGWLSVTFGPPGGQLP